MSSRSNCTRHTQCIYQSLTLVETRTRSKTVVVVVVVVIGPLAKVSLRYVWFSVYIATPRKSLKYVYLV